MVKKIINVYQKKEGIFGFGDYLRGCVFLIDFCDKNNIEFDMDFFDHPIGNYFENSKKYNINKNNIFSLEHFGLNDVYVSHEFLKKFISDNDQDIMYFTINSMNLNLINQDQKDRIKNNIRPIPTLFEKIKLALQNLNLISKKYITIHVRLNDDYIFTNMDMNGGLYDIVKKLVIMYSSIHENVLLISSSKRFKEIIKNDVLKLKMENKEIVHIGLQSESKEIINSLVDFFLLVNSSKIYQISTYPFGSGFSNYSSLLFNIPIEKNIIDDWHIKHLKQLQILKLIENKKNKQKVEEKIIIPVESKKSEDPKINYLSRLKITNNNLLKLKLLQKKY